MKFPAIVILLVSVSLMISCNKEEDPAAQNTVNHIGEKWNIVSVDYTIIDQSLSGGQLADNGTASNAGAFYFNSGNGSFDISIKSSHREDVFSYTENGSDVSIISIAQNVGSANFSQNVIALSGEKTSATSMTLSGTITKQSLSGQYVLTATFTLQKN